MSFVANVRMALDLKRCEDKFVTIDDEEVIPVDDCVFISVRVAAPNASHPTETLFVTRLLLDRQAVDVHSGLPVYMFMEQSMHRRPPKSVKMDADGTMNFEATVDELYTAERFTALEPVEHKGEFYLRKKDVVRRKFSRVIANPLYYGFKKYASPDAVPTEVLEKLVAQCRELVKQKIPPIPEDELDGIIDYLDMNRGKYAVSINWHVEDKSTIFDVFGREITTKFGIFIRY